MAETRRTRMTKLLMKDALLELMEEKPVSKISISSICEAADINRSTFYAHYMDIYALLEDVENDVLNQIPNLASEDDIKNNTEFKKLNVEFFEYVKQNARTFNVLLVNSNEGGFQNLLINRIMEKYYRPNSDVSDIVNKYYYFYIINGSIGMLKEWIRDGFQLNSHDFANIILDFAVGKK